MLRRELGRIRSSRRVKHIVRQCRLESFDQAWRGAKIDGRAIEFILAQAKAPVCAMLEKTGLEQEMGPDRMFPTLEGAVLAISRAQR